MQSKAKSRSGGDPHTADRLPLLLFRAIIGPGLIREFQRQNLPPPCRSVRETKWHAAGPTMTLRK